MKRDCLPLCAASLISALAMQPQFAKAQTGRPSPLISGERYDVTIADKSEIVSVQSTATGQKVITFRSSALNNVAAGYSILNFENLYPQSRFAHLRNIWRIQVNGNTLAFLNALQSAAPAIFSSWNKVEIPTLCYTPNDYYKGFWSSGYLEAIHARTAWDYSKGSGNTVIGVTDNYFDLNNPDLTVKFAQASLNNPSALRNHGTHVAGIIAGGTDNDTGYASIGFNCKLHAEDYLQGDAANYDLSIINNRRIINASWGRFNDYSATTEDLYNEMYENGTLMVGAAGNGYHGFGVPSSLYLYPASYDHVFSVTGCRWLWNDPSTPVGGHAAIPGDSMTTQQHNDRVDLMAPSFHIGGLISEDSNATGKWRWFNDGGLHGTSFAAPLVAGTAGLMIDTMPCLTPYQIEYILKKTADTSYLTLAENLPYTGRLGAGGLNAGEAVKVAATVDSNTGLDACNDSASRTLYIKGFEFTSACAPGAAANGHLPQLSAVIENGIPPYRYRWQALDSNTTKLDDSFAAAPTIVSSTANAAGQHAAHYRLTVYDNSEVPKTAKRFLLLPLRTTQDWDLALRDSYMDVCDEPNKQFIRNARDWQIWESPDLWVRQTADGQTTPQTPEWTAGTPNTIYTRIRNIGCTAFDSASNSDSRLRLYWTKASTGERWPQDWIGQTLVSGYNGGAVTAGGVIGSLKVPNLQPGEARIVGQQWQPTAPQSFAATNPGDPAPETVDVCLLGMLATSLSDPFGISIPVAWGNIKHGVNNNNNIVTRNLIVQNKVAGRPGLRSFVDVANPEQESGKFTLELINEKAINKHFSGDYAALGTVHVSLGNLYSRWQEGGGIAEGNFYKEDEKKALIWDGTGSIRLKNITLGGGERFTTDIAFVLRTDVKMPSMSYTFHLRQFAEGTPANGLGQNPDGNVSLVVATGEETTTIAARPSAANDLLPGTITSNVSTAGWKVYPNPATDAVVIARAGKMGTASISLYDISGRRVVEKQMPERMSEMVLQTGGFAAGVYTLKIQEANGSAEIRKLTLQNR